MTTRAEALFHPEGEIYSPLRLQADVPSVESYRLAFFLRDPRDVLVSAYYSFGYSHETRSVKERAKRFDRSGQFEAELKPETIAILNEKLAPHLAYWSFDQRRKTS